MSNTVYHPQTAMQKLMADPKVRYIHNTNGPKLAYIELSRDKDGKVKEFITHYELNVFKESNHDRSVLVNSTDNNWKELSEKDITDIKVAREEKVKGANKTSAPQSKTQEEVKEAKASTTVGVDMAKGKDETITTIVNKPTAPTPVPTKEVKK